MLPSVSVVNPEFFEFYVHLGKQNQKYNSSLLIMRCSLDSCYYIYVTFLWSCFLIMYFFVYLNFYLFLSLQAKCKVSYFLCTLSFIEGSKTCRPWLLLTEITLSSKTPLFSFCFLILLPWIFPCFFFLFIILSGRSGQVVVNCQLWNIKLDQDCEN